MTSTRYLSILAPPPPACISAPALSLLCYLTSLTRLLLQLFRAAKVKWCTERTRLCLSAAETKPSLCCTTKALHQLSKHISIPRHPPMSVQINRYKDVAHTPRSRNKPERVKKIWIEEGRAEVPGGLRFAHTAAEGSC